MGGVVIGSGELLQSIRRVATNLGPTPSPFDSWLILRGVKTLALRMERHCANAQELAEMLAAHPAVLSVHYPGLTTAVDHELALRQFRQGFGGMLSFEVTGGTEGEEEVMRALRLIDLVPSLAGVTTTVSHPAKTSHRGLSETERAALGIGDGLIRLSVGIEAVSDLKADLGQALDLLLA